MKHYTVIFQCFLCALLLAFLVIIKANSQNTTVEVSTLGKTPDRNDTLYDFCGHIYGQLTYE